MPNLKDDDFIEKVRSISNRFMESFITGTRDPMFASKESYQERKPDKQPDVTRTYSKS